MVTVLNVFVIIALKKIDDKHYLDSVTFHITLKKYVHHCAPVQCIIIILCLCGRKFY